MKTVMDAVNEFKGDDSPFGYFHYSNRLKQWASNGGEYINSGYYKVCNSKQFNTLVQECSRHAGGELYERYIRAKKSPLAKESKVDIDWSKAPEDATHYWPKMNSFYKFSKHDNDFVWQNYEWQRCASIDCFGGELTEKTLLPVFTQEMSDNGELPPIGSDVEYNDDIDFDFKFDWDNGDIITCVFHSTNDKGEPIGVYRHNDGVTVSLVTNLIRPIDTRTDKEKDIDEACLIIDDSKRCVDTNINIDCSAAQKAVIITMINNGYKKT